MGIVETKNIFTLAGPTTPGRPFINESQIGALSVSSTFLADKRTLMNWIKRTPEAIGMIRQIGLDVVTKINFVAMDTPSMGRPKKNKGKDNVTKAEEFARQNFLKQTLRAAVIDELALGDGYIWKGEMNDSDKQTAVNNTLKQIGKYINVDFKALDEDFNNERVLEYVPASTMDIEIKQSGTEIDSFIQRTGFSFGNQTFPSGRNTTTQGTSVSRTRRWKPSQIIHKKFMKLDGKVHGFTPMQSSFPVIKTLGLIKDYHGHFFDSGITPDHIFNFEELNANSNELEKMRQVIAEWYNNKRRSFAVTTSKMNIETLNEWNKDMEFRMLSIYYTGVMAFSMGMPLEKIRAILGGEIKSTTGGSDISNTDYQKNVEDMQDDWETLMNTQFFNETFQVNMRFDRSAARDEIAEVQRDSQKLNNLKTVQEMDLIKKDHMVDFVEVLFPNVPSGWWNSNPKPETDMGMGMIPSSKALPSGQSSEALSEQKKQEQKPQQKNNPPQGR